MVKRLLKVSVILALVLCFSAVSFAVAGQAGKQDLVQVGSNIEVPADTTVNSAVVLGGSATIAGRVLSDVVAVGGPIHLKGSSVVEGNVVSVGGKIDKEEGATIGGDVVEIYQEAINPIVGFLSTGGMTVGTAMLRALIFISFLLLAVVIVAFFTPQLGKVSAKVEKKAISSFWWGLLGVILVVPIIIVLAVSIIGIVFIPLWVMLMVAIGFFGYISASQLFGKKVLHALKIRNKPMMLETLLGITLLFAIGFIPVIGWLIKCIFFLCGVGAVILTRFGMEA